MANSIATKTKVGQQTKNGAATTNNLYTDVVKGGSKTLFLDLRRAKNDAPYLVITALGRDQAGNSERRTVTIFGQQIKELSAALVNLIQSQQDVFK